MVNCSTTILSRPPINFVSPTFKLLRHCILDHSLILGAELSILESIPLDVVKIQIFFINYGANRKMKRALIKYFDKHNYQIVADVSSEILIFINPNLVAGKENFFFCCGWKVKRIFETFDFEVF